MNPRKRKSLRLFNGLVGRETSITQKIRTTAPTDPRYKKPPIDITISSADLDPALYTPKDSLDRVQSVKESAAEFAIRNKQRLNGASVDEGRSDWDVHLQTYSFQPSMNHAEDPILYMGGNLSGRGEPIDADGKMVCEPIDGLTAGSIATAAQSMPHGFIVQQMRGLGNAIPRKMPWWIKNPTTLLQFRDGLSDDIAGQVDFGILKAYYFLSASDKEILDSFRCQYVRESGKKVSILGRTVTEAAIKMRRRRLVQDGDLIFGKPPAVKRPQTVRKLRCPAHSDLYGGAVPVVTVESGMYRLECGCLRGCRIGSKITCIDEHKSFQPLSALQDTDIKAEAR